MSTPNVQRAPFDRRPVVAFGMAPLMMLLALPVSLLFTTSDLTADVLVRSIQSTAFVGIFWLPAAYVVEVAVGVPIYVRWLRDRQRIWHIVLPVSALSGALVMTLPWRIPFQGRLTFDPGLVGIGAALGMATGAVFLGMLSAVRSPRSDMQRDAPRAGDRIHQ